MSLWKLCTMQLVVLLGSAPCVQAGSWTPFGGSAAAFATTPMPKRKELQHKMQGHPQYELASVDLSSRWVDLVKNEQVVATVSLVDEAGDDVSVRYGVRLATTKDPAETRCEEFVELAISEAGETSRSEIVRRINETLATLQEKSSSGDAASATNNGVKHGQDGDFVAQLQLVRTLRPPPSPGFSGSTTSDPPPYDSSTDSFVTGPLRLDLRPLIGKLELPDLTTPWDIFHNVSPADTRGHFLLLPTLADKENNWRGQSFTKDDCNDIVHLTSAIKPVGSLLLGFNSVGAGASQNHIHCHAWPSPPIPLQQPVSGEVVNDMQEGWNCYAVSKVDSIYDFCDTWDGKVEVSYLRYPVFCLQLSAAYSNLKPLGRAVAATLAAIGEAPYNIGFLNRQEMDEEGDKASFVDVFVFARSKERADSLSSLKLGISEMMGVFHAQSDSELELLTTTQNEEDKKGPMYQALEDVSHEDEEDLWESIQTKLKELDESKS